MRKQIPLIISITIPALLACFLVSQNNLTFWYDPARDLLAAWDNLSKITLIGPTSGIPGIFYGPYWIWLLSMGLLFSKNPVVVTFITATLPYVLVLPFVWFRLKRVFHQTALFCGWLLFMLGTGTIYATELWNPYPAPLFTIVLLTLLLLVNVTTISLKNSLKIILAGFFLGLIIAFHLSFGISLLLGLSLFYVTDIFRVVRQSRHGEVFTLIKKYLLNLVLFVGGLFVSFLPTLFFEIRHGFNQTHTLLYTLSKFGNVITIKGLGKEQIFQEFLNTFGKLMHMPSIVAGCLFVFLLVIVFYNRYKNVDEKPVLDRALLLSLCSICGTVLLYFTARNPVWTYHFIGVEIPLLFFLVYCSTKFSSFRKLLLVWTLGIFAFSLFSFGNTLDHKQTYFSQQKEVVKTIAADARNDKYVVYAYSPSIYIYEYSYLFRWLANKDIPYDPGQVKPNSPIVYLIVPPQKDARVLDFINFRAPKNQYRTVNIWHTSGGVTIMKEKQLVRDSVKKIRTF